MMNRDSGADRRRSSIKNPLVQEEVRSIKGGRPHEVVNSEFPGLKLNNDTRLSGNSMRNTGSLGALAKRTGIPTPQTGGAQRSRQGALNDTRDFKIKAAMNRSRVPTIGSAANRPRSTSASRAGPGGKAKPSSFAFSQGYGLNNTRRKSVSHESLLQTPSLNFSVTASARRSRSRSPGSSLQMSSARRRVGVINDAGEQTKIKITKDKNLISDMARIVFNFLEEQDCVSRPTNWKHLISPAKDFSISKFVGIFKFLASQFVGKDFFIGTKPDEETEEILEVVKILKYPGPLTKSTLKTANATHSWPTCLTLLYWLTSRLIALNNPPAERNNISELNGNGYQENAFLSFLTLFPYHFQRVITEEHIEEELKHFKDRLCETHAVECSKTLEELKQEKEERSSELEKLRKESNPARSIRERLDKEQATEAELRDQIREVENQCKEFSNTNHILLEQENIKLNIKTKQAEIARLKKQAAEQPLSNDQAVALQNDTRILRAQLDSILAINAKLDEEHKSRLKRKETLMNELSEMCRQFSIVEQYNEIIRYLQLDERLRIPPNPFGPKELEAWMKSTAETLSFAEEHVNELQQQLKLRSNMNSKENMELALEKEKLLTQINEFKMKLSQLQNYEKTLYKKHEKEQQDGLVQLKCCNDELRHSQAQFKNAQDFEVFVKNRYKEFLDAIAERQKDLESLNKNYKETWGQQQVERENVLRMIPGIRNEFRARQEAFYKEKYGLELQKVEHTNKENHKPKEGEN